MSNGRSDGRRDDAFVDRLGDRISASPAQGRVVGPVAPTPAPVMRPGDFGEESTLMSAESEPPPPPAGTLPAPMDGSGLYDGLEQPPPSRPVDAFAEFEASEMPGESTRIEESEIIADQSTAILDEGPKMPVLFVESGKDKGKEYVLQEGETGVGRGIDNDVILTDVSVSRKHLRVLRDGASLVLRDLGSGNGTTVNGKRVHQIVLSEGDRIELGETVLVVKLPAEGAASPAMATSGHTSERAAPQEQPQQPPMIPAWTAPMPPISSSSETVAPRDGNTATVRLPRRTLVFAVAGIAAVALFVGVGVGAVMLVAGRGAETATPLPVTPVPPVPMPTGVPVVAVPPTAAGAPIGVPQVPPTSVVFAPPTTGLVLAPPATGVPTPMPPTSVAMPLGPAAPIAVTSATPPPVTAAPEPEPEPVADAPRGRSGRSPRPTREPAPSGSAGAQARITSAYNSGDFDGAAAIARDAARHSSGADQRSLESLANNIDSFAGLYPRIRAAGDALGPVAGIVPIALRLDRQIVSGGHYAREIQPRYVRFLVTQARGQISSAPQTACPRVRDALDLDASNADAQGLARQCETTAARMLSDAQSHERSDAAGAQRTYTAIQTMVPRTSATYRTAGERLTALRRTAPAASSTTPRRMDEDE